jgi:VanZ family protein
MAMLMLVSVIPGNPKPGDSVFIWLISDVPTLLQKILHVCLYGVLALLLAWTLDGVEPRSFRFLIILVIAVGFGAAMEWLQTKVPGRYGTVFDVALDAVGAALGLIAAAFML